jgi:arylsulfatase A-like enzyme
MRSPVVLCLVVDGWHVGYWGAYGNTHVATPEADRWAAAGLLMDQCSVNSPDLEAAYRALWQGVGPFEPIAAGVPSDSIAGRFAASGYRTLLVADDPAVLKLPAAADFAEHRAIALPESAGAPTPAADAVEETELFRIFSTLGDTLQSVAEGTTPAFVWAHARGFYGPWDAPYSMRIELTDEGDPPPPAEVLFAHRMVAADIDPDELLGLRTAYAAQVRVLDLCLGALDELIDELGIGDRTTVVLTSTRGFPLGEHGRIGLVDHALYEELVHVPLVVRFAAPADGRSSTNSAIADSDAAASPTTFASIACRPWATARSQRLVQHSDLAATLLAHFGIAADRRAGRDFLAGLDRAPDDPAAVWRDHVCLARICPEGGNDVAIRTAAWRLLHRDGSDAAPQLFVKPDDRWEVNDVASRCGEVVEGLQAALARARALQASGAQDLPPLDAILREGLG